MQFDPAAILALISTLTAQNAQLAQENAALNAQLGHVGTPCCEGPAGEHQPTCPKGP